MQIIFNNVICVYSNWNKCEKMAMRGRPKAPGMVQICFRVPNDVAEFIREMSTLNDRQPGAELARMLRPLMEVERKRRAWEQQQKAPIRHPDPVEAAPAKRGGKKPKPLAAAEERSDEPDLFGPPPTEASADQG